MASTDSPSPSKPEHPKEPCWLKRLLVWIRRLFTSKKPTADTKPKPGNGGETS